MNTPEMLSKLQTLLERVRARSRAQGLPRAPDIRDVEVQPSGPEARRPVGGAPRSVVEPPRAGVPPVARAGREGLRTGPESPPVSEPRSAREARPVPEVRSAPEARGAGEATRSEVEARGAVWREPARPEPPRPVIESVHVATPTTPDAQVPETEAWTPAPPAAESDIVIEVEETEPLRTTMSEAAEVPDSTERASESDERLRAAKAVASESETEGDVARTMPPSDLAAAEEASLSAPPAEVEPEEAPRATEALEQSERAPASSRRPVALAAEDHLAQMAFGTEESPIPHHTPPPESGRLPSASVDEFDDTAGIPGAQVEETGRKVISHLVAESTRANLQRSDVVVEAVGEARRFVPATFLALLEASLDL